MSGPVSKAALRASIQYLASLSDDDTLERQRLEASDAIERCGHELAIAHITHEAVRDELMRRGHSLPALEDVGTFFGLTYSSYFILQRALMEAMPIDWQRRFCALVNEVGDEFNLWDERLCDAFWVRAKNASGAFVRDPLAEYRRPDTALIDALRRRQDDSIGHLVGDGAARAGAADLQPGQGDQRQDQSRGL